MYVTNLVDVTNLRVRHKSREVQNYSKTAQISLRRSVISKIMGGRRPLREQTVVTLDRDFTHFVAFRNLVYVTNPVEVTNIRILHKSR